MCSLASDFARACGAYEEAVGDLRARNKARLIIANDRGKFRETRIASAARPKKREHRSQWAAVSNHLHLAQSVIDGSTP